MRVKQGEVCELFKYGLEYKKELMILNHYLTLVDARH